MGLSVDKAAIRHHGGTVYSVERPGRHHDVMRSMVDEGVPEPIGGDYEQGFLLSDGRFARRVAALYVAVKCGQLKQEDITPTNNKFGLFSEDLW